MILHPKPFQSSKYQRAVWFENKKKIIKLTFFIYVFTLIFLVMKLALSEILFYLHLGLLVVIYEVQVIKLKVSLRKIPYLKSFIISYVWVMATCFIPVYSSDAHPIYYLECFLFIWVLTMAFDIRDENYDHQQGLKTFIGLWGARKNKVFITLVFTFNLILLHAFLIPKSFIASLSILTFFLVMIFKIRDQISDYYLIFGIDSIIMMKLLYLI